MKSVLTIGGSDPSGGAGLQGDLKVFKTFGVHGLSVPAALTAQNTSGVEAILPVEKGFFTRQIDVLLRDIRPDALKAGMMYSGWAVEVIAEKIKAFSLTNFVLDPVTVSSTGISLVDEGTLDKIREILFPLSRVITPNIYEASVFTGMNIEDEASMQDAAIVLKKMGPEVVVITGGHLERVTLDMYYDGNDFHEIESEKISGEYHGTGCAFSAAIAASLAIGHPPLDSVRRAKEFVTGAIRKAHHLGKGMGLLNL
ncbi:MAG TPA: bifunctional hydroxymethylpyrimidine kinase/phosphomethylpyrimidine kinase [Nitrospiraceae bacterium]|jgi:hydroxymethylpyrimidine/phosphomethylpyrimidine kinase|nr:bifunctional hydroxymethylpyrimidine kinase/phosphomethylpyrimidine kinase [Nitrospiraceae bacterium]